MMIVISISSFTANLFTVYFIVCICIPIIGDYECSARKLTINKQLNMDLEFPDDGYPDAPSAAAAGDAGPTAALDFHLI